MSNNMFGGPIFRGILKVVLFPWWLKQKLTGNDKDAEERGRRRA